MDFQDPIPAFAGMTKHAFAGMTKRNAGMTKRNAGMKKHAFAGRDKGIIHSLTFAIFL